MTDLTSRLSTAHSSRYINERVLGQGGMATVAQLGRLVWRAVIICLMLGAIVGCREVGTPQDMPNEVRTASPEIEPLPGTARMAAELAAIYRTALGEPMRYGHLNSRRADMWRAEIARTEGSEQVMARYRYASELLSAGDTETAIREIERLMKDAGPEGSVVSPTTKPLFELLAIAYLRLGEQQNRLNDPAGASILPLTANAVHTKAEGSRRAISLYKEILDRFPRDLQTRWLLNIAYMTLGMYPRDVPAHLLIEGLEPGLDTEYPRFQNVAPALGVNVDGIAGGVSLEDFNEDGLIDILVTARGLNDPLRLFFADGHGGFVDHTGAAGLNGLVGGLNTLHADYNNDGYDDVLIVRGGWLGANGAHPNSLLKNNGNGTFEDVAAAAGLLSRHPTQTAAWGDFNNDGWLDIFMGNEAGRNGGGSGRSELYLNNGDGTFTEISARVGINVYEFVKGVAWGDINNDGLIDLYISVLDNPNKLYLNQGGGAPEDWRFEEVGTSAGVQEPVFSFPVFFWDYNNDGWEDLFVASFDVALSFVAPGEIAAEYLGLRVKGERNRVYRNNGDGTFTDVAPDLGLDLSHWAMGINFGDLNNDGFPDIYVGTGTPDLRSVMPNRMFLNENGTRFRDITFDGGFGHLQKGHAIAFADFDRDGDQDIYAVMGGAVEGDHFPNALFENPGFGDGNSWVVLQLEGRSANRSAIGARISVTVTDMHGEKRVICQTVNTGGSFGASSLQQEIGLGQTGRIDELKLSWPNHGQTADVHLDLPVNTHYRIIEGQDAVRLHVAPAALTDQP
jgi:hypothetical protein